MIPVAWVYEPNWGLASTSSIESIWLVAFLRGHVWKEPGGQEWIAMAVLTLNDDGHGVMRSMHRPGDERRSVVILRPDDWEEWRTALNIEAAGAMLQLYPADETLAAPK
ncbi:hypothetical protein [Burkholderia gladioli]|uniref:hypothetical protein n=1 Tax=Burkholderia gladioli TaxID=28095 RepID=UPI0016420746|nr:hypothetical protein [Burkholderia gladioli]